MLVHLHNHSHYSLLDGLGTIDQLIAKAKEQGSTALALTDHGTMYGVIEFYQKCKAADIKPIIGVEIYLATGSMHDKNAKSKPYHLVLLAKNYDWYKNIIQLVTHSNLYWFYRVPRIDFELLKKYSSNLICLSWSIDWDISYQILSWKSNEKIKERIELYENIYWKENYYLELLYHEDIPK